jgi:hypothetical protein
MQKIFSKGVQPMGQINYLKQLAAAQANVVAALKPIIKETLPDLEETVTALGDWVSQLAHEQEDLASRVLALEAKGAAPTRKRLDYETWQAVDIAKEDGHTAKEIGQLLDLPLSTVRKYLAMDKAIVAKLKLKDELMSGVATWQSEPGNLDRDLDETVQAVAQVFSGDQDDNPPEPGEDGTFDE